MPSSRYIAVDSHSRIPSFHKNIYGGAAPLLLKNIIRQPIIKGGDLDGGKSNRVIVGTVCSPVNIPKSSGGELLNSIQNLKFGKGAKRKSDQNIKFLF